MTPREELLLELLAEVRQPRPPTFIPDPGTDLYRQLADTTEREGEQRRKAEHFEAKAKDWAKSADELHAEKQRLEKRVAELEDLLKWTRADAIKGERQALLEICKSHGLVGEPGSMDTRVLHVNAIVKNIMEAVRKRGEP